MAGVHLTGAHKGGQTGMAGPRLGRQGGVPIPKCIRHAAMEQRHTGLDHQLGRFFPQPGGQIVRDSPPRRLLRLGRPTMQFDDLPGQFPLQLAASSLVNSA
jgi:hypothetical protein